MIERLRGLAGSGPSEPWYRLFVTAHLPQYHAEQVQHPGMIGRAF